MQRYSSLERPIRQRGPSNAYSESALRSDIGNSSRQHERDCGSPSASTRDIETAPNQIRSFTHACKTEVPSLMRKESIRFQPYSIILNQQLKLRGRERHLNVEVLNVGMLACVAEIL
jgi:hypothetical protein